MDGMDSNAWAYLLPSIGELFSGTPAGISAFIWLLMYAFLMYAGNYVLTRFFKCKKTFTLLRTFEEELSKDLSMAKEYANSLREDRSTRRFSMLLRDLLANLYPVEDYDSNDQSADSIQYRCSAPFNDFIHVREISPELFDNKFISFVPSLLTGIGVLGTFIGIQLGIGGLSFNADDVESVTKSITMLLAGSTVAFMTSIWGIFFSLTFGIGEKVLLRQLQQELLNIQDTMAHRVSFVAPENEIVLMRGAQEQATESLEAIQDAMQKLDFTPVVTGVGRELDRVMSTSEESMRQREEDREAIREIGALIVSELRLLRESKGSSSEKASIVKVR